MEDFFAVRESKTFVVPHLIFNLTLRPLFDFMVLRKNGISFYRNYSSLLVDYQNYEKDRFSAENISS
jgi:hypothetical protein